MEADPLTADGRDFRLAATSTIVSNSDQSRLEIIEPAGIGQAASRSSAGRADACDVRRVGFRSALEHRRTGDQNVRASARQKGRGFRRDAAVDLNVDVALADHSLDSGDLVHHRRDEGLAAEPGHYENEVESVEHIFDRGLRRRRGQRDVGLSPKPADFLQRSVKMSVRFGVNADDVRARLGEGVEIRIARLNHQMAVEDLVGMRAQRRDNRGPERDVEYEYPSITSR